MPLSTTFHFLMSHPLTRDHQPAALLRFARWQLRSRLSAGPHVHPWINGAQFLVRRGETGLTGNVYTGLHEFTDMAFVLHLLREEDLFIDVGANVGSYTLLACAAAGASGMAFEPVPSTFERLQANLDLNRLADRVQAFNRALGGEAGEIAFSSSSDCTNHALADGEEREDAITVPVSTMDRELEAKAPLLMKIDVEGFETPVIEGGGETLAKRSLQAVIMELNGSGKRYGFDESLILQRMLDHGFKTFAYDPLQRSLHNLDGKNLDSGNTLFIRDEQWVTQRIQSAPAFKVLGHEI